MKRWFVVGAMEPTLEEARDAIEKAFGSSPSFLDIETSYSTSVAGRCLVVFDREVLFQGGVSVDLTPIKPRATEEDE